jgi:DEAD/DEAH box helicase domain-containing protein
MPPTRADFVFWPAVPKSGIKPIAIYLDGWQWHADRIPDDLALRQKLIGSGHLLVWSLSWDDLERNVEDGRPKHYWDPLSPVPRDRVEKLTDGGAVANDLQDIIGASSFDHLLRLLRDPDPAAWAKRACNISTSLFLNGMTAGKEKNKVMGDTEAMAGPEGLSTIDAVATTALFGMVNTTGVGTVTVAADRQWLPPAWPAPDALTTVVGFEHQLAVSSEAKRAWNGALRLLNLLQFLPWIFVGCRDGIPLPPAIRPSAPHTEDGWAEIEQVVLADIMPLVAKLRQRSVTLPEALFEVTNPDGSVAGTLELAWPEQKVGVVLDRNLVRLFPGWTVVDYSGNDDEVATIIGDEL